jgi:uncharacterized membrane protein
LSRTKNIALAASATALALGLGLGVTTMASATATPSPAPSASTGAAAEAHPGKGGMTGHHGKAGDRHAAALAAKLGVDPAKVTEALKSFRDANKADRTAKETALAKSLAASLGVDESKVTAAIIELRSVPKADRAAALKAKLDKAVAAGTLTQAEADAVTKAVEKGVFGGPKK